MTNFALILVVVLVSFPCLVLLVECLAAVLPARRRQSIRPATYARTAILIPAHNEEAGIGATVAALLPELAMNDRLIVIADNCTDATATVARAAGAIVVERSEPGRRGKGFAIAFGLHFLDAAPPEVVVLVDADCRLSPVGGVALLARLCRERNRPVQAEYVPAAPPKATPLGVVGGLALLVRNRVRPRGLARLGLPCQLTGSGMAFPWKVLRQAPDTGANLVEDLVMGLEMAVGGHPPLACSEVQVASELPEGDKAALGQRRRWEHGQIATLAHYGPRLLMAGLLRARLDLLGLALDLLVPPLALLVMMVGAVTGLAAITAAMGWSSWMAAGIGMAAFAALTVGVGTAWLRFGRQTLAFRFLLVVPFYVLWKIPLYFSLLLARKQKTWERTARNGVATEAVGDGVNVTVAVSGPL
jgi:cellulose synthase/poly-beta-1,6-N-acetylglucosamine synthase-like glycosyltransferase